VILGSRERMCVNDKFEHLKGKALSVTCTNAGGLPLYIEPKETAKYKGKELEEFKKDYYHRKNKCYYF
jgi:hypothetical protein